MALRRNLRQIGASDQPRPLDPVRARRAGQQDAYEFGAGLEPRGRQITVKLRVDGGLAFSPDGSIYVRVDGTPLAVENGRLGIDVAALVAALPLTSPGLTVSTKTGALGVTMAGDPGAAPNPAPSPAPATSLGVLAAHVNTISAYIDTITDHVDDLQTKLQAAGLMKD